MIRDRDIVFWIFLSFISLAVVLAVLRVYIEARPYAAASFLIVTAFVLVLFLVTHWSERR